MSEQRNSEQTASPEGRTNSLAAALSNVGTGLRNLQWVQVILFGTLAGVLMPFVMTQGDVLSFAAGIVPVGAGLIVGRRVKGYYGLHGFMTGLLAAVIAVLLLGGLLFFTPLGATLADRALEQNVPPEYASIQAQWGQLGMFIAFALLTFCTFGATMSGRSEERNRQLRAEVEARGGRLERPSAVRAADDIRGMSLPQFGGYVNNLFKKQGFRFKDYRFLDKDKHLDLWLDHEGETWHLRLSVADKVAPGTIESLIQEMKREDCRKGVVLTSTEFTPGAVKSAKGRPVVLIDGPTLYEIAEK